MNPALRNDNFARAFWGIGGSHNAMLYSVISFSTSRSSAFLDLSASDVCKRSRLLHDTRDAFAIDNWRVAGQIHPAHPLEVANIWWPIGMPPKLRQHIRADLVSHVFVRQRALSSIRKNSTWCVTLQTSPFLLPFLGQAFQEPVYLAYEPWLKPYL